MLRQRKVSQLSSNNKVGWSRLSRKRLQRRMSCRWWWTALNWWSELQFTISFSLHFVPCGAIPLCCQSASEDCVCIWSQLFCVAQFFSEFASISARASRAMLLCLFWCCFEGSHLVCRTLLFSSLSTSGRNEIQIYFPVTLVKRLFFTLKSHTLARLHVDALDFLQLRSVSFLCENGERELECCSPHCEIYIFERRKNEQPHHSK
jgi:hypothetical protein